MLQSLAGADFFTGILPFILAYVIFFFTLKGLTGQMSVFQDKNNDTFAALVAIVFAFYTARFMLMNPGFQNFLLNYTGRLVLILVAFLGLMTVLAFTGIRLTNDNGGAKLIGGVMTLIILAAFFVSGGVGTFFQGSQALSEGMQIVNFILDSGLIWVLVVLGVLGFTMTGGGGSSDRTYIPFGPIGGNGEGNGGGDNPDG